MNKNWTEAPKNGFSTVEGQHWVLDQILQQIDNIQYWAERIHRRETDAINCDTLDDLKHLMQNAEGAERMVLTWLDNMEVMA